MKRLVLLIAFVFLSGNSLLLLSQDSCGIIWDAPILLSDTSHDALSPKIALSGEDTVHAVWFGGGTIRLPYTRSTNGGQSFGPRTELLPDSAGFPIAANRPTAVAWQRNVYVFFQGATPGIYSPIRMVKSTDGGNTWSYPSDISPDTSGPPPLTPTILGDTIAMSYVPRGQVPHNILRSTDGGATWVSINAGLPNSHRFALSAGVALSPGVLHLVQGNVEVEYRRSLDLGDTWNLIGIISEVDGFGSAIPAIGAADSLVLAAWREARYGCLTLVGCGIAGRWSFDTGSAFGAETRFDTHPAGVDAKVAMHGNTLAVVWTDDLEQNVKMRVSFDRGLTWCAPMNVSQNGGGLPEIALSRRAAHVVWFGGDMNIGQTLRIFYRRGRFTTTSAGEHPALVPTTVTLVQNYPNPFNSTTKIVYRVGSRESVSLRLFDVLGREVATLVTGAREAGTHEATWDATGRPSGVYYYRLVAQSQKDGTRILTKKMILIR